MSAQQDYDTRIREFLAQVPEGQWKEFAAFAGPRLDKLTGWDKIVLLGDASHPLSGESSHTCTNTYHYHFCQPSLP